MNQTEGAHGSPRVVLQSPQRDGVSWISLESPSEVLVATTLEEVRPTLSRAVEASEHGSIVAGFVSYEAAPAFDPSMRVHPESKFPFIWFGIFEQAEALARLPLTPDPISTTSWNPTLTAEDYGKAVATIRRLIERGDTYQVNFTHRLKGDFQGDTWHFFKSFCRGQRSDCCAYVDTGDLVLCSASPELFFHLEDTRIRCKPMKGTASRGRTLEEDRGQARWLRTSPKNRAENVMIVDMVRNDLGRIAEPETVRVARLWDLEKYPSLYQLTSTVEARTEAAVDEIFAALFPCASITGAPKIRAMEIIRDLESSPREAYTGAIGVIGPGRRARFNVAIRTIQIDSTTQQAVYGTGGGIVWDSVAADEWRECRTKALVLKPPPPEFDLLETMLWEPVAGVFLLGRHLDRLAASATYFDYPFDPQLAVRELQRHTQGLPHQPHRLRLRLDRRGGFEIESALVEAEQRPWRLALADKPVDHNDPFLFHKTTFRQTYREHRERWPTHTDVLLWNEDREITESTLANVVMRIGRRLLTPRLASGLLAGTFRAELLDRREIEEATIRLEDLGTADEILLINSVRKWIPAILDSDPFSPLGETPSPPSA